eukprot:13261-Eustigmatos_ZCMA.PRE.1
MSADEESCIPHESWAVVSETASEGEGRSTVDAERMHTCIRDETVSCTHGGRPNSEVLWSD